jgi:ribonuclease VapC
LYPAGRPGGARRGRHPARLNFGDCVSCALAQSKGEPLLFVGEDFARTDIQPVRYR